MPSSSKLQRKFFKNIQNIQKGKKHPLDVSPEIRRVSRRMSSKDVDDFVNTPEKGLPWKVKKEVLSVLGGIREPMYLNEIEINPVTTTFVQRGIFNNYINHFVGQPFSQKEMEAIDSFKELRPTSITRTQIKYQSTDNFLNTTTTIIKKLKDGNNFVYTSFSKVEKEKSEEDENRPGEESRELEKSTEIEEDKIRITKSIIFDDEIKGGEILAEFLKRLDL